MIASTMKQRRGTKAKVLTDLVVAGQMVITNDTQELYFGNNESAAAVPVPLKMSTANLIGAMTPAQMPALTLPMMPTEVQNLIGSVEECGEISGATGFVTSKTADCPAAVPAIGVVLPAAAVANKGWMFYISAAGNWTIDGQTGWDIGDQIYSNGSKWRKIDNSQDGLLDGGLIP